MKETVYTHKTRGSGYLARRAQTSSGEVDYAWFLVNIEGREHVRHAGDFVFVALREPITVMDLA